MEKPANSPSPSHKRARRIRVALHFLLSFMGALCVGHLVDRILNRGETKKDLEPPAQQQPQQQAPLVDFGPLLNIQARAYTAVKSSAPWIVFGSYFQQIFAPGLPSRQTRLDDLERTKWLRFGNDLMENQRRNLESVQQHLRPPQDTTPTLVRDFMVKGDSSPAAPSRPAINIEAIHASLLAQQGISGATTNISANWPVIVRPATALIDVFVRHYYSRGFTGLMVAVVQFIIGCGLVCLFNTRVREEKKVRHPLLFIPFAIVLGTFAAIPIWLGTLVAIKTVGVFFWLAGLAMQFTISLFTLLWLSVKLAGHYGETMIESRLAKLLGV